MENNQTTLKKPWYLETFFICVVSAFAIFVVPAIAAIILLILQKKFDKQFAEAMKVKIKLDLEDEVNKAKKEAQEIVDANKIILQRKIENEEKLSQLTVSVEKLEKQENSLKNKSKKIRIAHKSVLASIKFYREHGEYREISQDDMDLITPTVEIQTHSMNVKDLKTKVTTIKKEINTLLDGYDKRYTTKANKSIYSLIVIGLQSELQNVLYTMKFDKKEKAIADIKNICSKYINIAGDGNQNIYATLVKFIGEVEHLFLNLVDTEYEYYTKKEAEKEEQRAIKEQMRQDAAERKQLEIERKKVEAEEEKFHTEINSITEQLKNQEDDEKLKQLEKRLKELEEQLHSVEEKKENITNLQNGKAGNVYIISNIGSFGEDVFKVGMTRRLDPMERVKELGDASVPFKFDVHSFIFSDDASKLETELHNILEEKRMNKVNKRKEFFRVTLDELEELVQSIDPTAEFTKTILAQEYRQTLEIMSA